MRLTAARAGVFYAVCAYRDSGMQVCVRFITAAFMPGPGDAAAARNRENLTRCEPCIHRPLECRASSDDVCPRTTRRSVIRNMPHKMVLRDESYPLEEGWYRGTCLSESCFNPEPRLPE